ncbi:hypothetical protein AC578_3457 [Pseudocercospora eumusae]|uniref:Uncharacterized protein n=1 Tax=Pseudocercospora eumusae TaxID=321146 RepID=A0A139HRD9_9PEZI|nr:hypothetical protein AC578_3457 [Pseudocercospora eumusae]
MSDDSGYWNHMGDYSDSKGDYDPRSGWTDEDWAESARFAEAARKEREEQEQKEKERREQREKERREQRMKKHGKKN